MDLARCKRINDIRFYFPDGILSLPFYHPNLKDLNEFKGKKGQRIEKYFWNQKEKVLEIEKIKLLYVYHQILTTEPKVFNINCKENFNQEHKKFVQKSTKDIVLGRQ